MKKRILLLLLAALACFMSGCAILTVDQMYRLPKRPEAYNDLQSVIDSAMVGLDYCAPRSGENQQTVQMADLDGDGIREYLLFAKGSSDKPLQVLVFRNRDDSFSLMTVIECSGSAFDQVEYVQMDGIGGMELVIGRQVSDQVLRSVSVYTFPNAEATLALTANYTEFLACDLNEDGCSELMVLRPGLTDADNGVAELYAMEDGAVHRANEAVMSGPSHRLKRILIGRLHGGKPAVFVGSTVEESAIITDVYALIDGVFTNVSLSNESGTSVQTLRSYYVCADDIDEDGEVELPDLITMAPPQNGSSAQEQYLIRWYAMDETGAETDKMYTYHNYLEGWYLQLDGAWAPRISVAQESGAYSFYLWDSAGQQAMKIFTVYALTGQDREQQALTDNRFVVYKGESVVYAAHMEVASGALEITPDDIINSFRLIRQDWKTGEM